MRLKYRPSKWNPFAEIKAQDNTAIEYVNENAIRIDGELNQFDPNAYEFDNIASLSAGKILMATRDDLGELWLDVRRYYTDSCTDWDTGDYHVFHG